MLQRQAKQGLGLTSCPPDALAALVRRVRASRGAASATFLHTAADILSKLHGIQRWEWPSSE